MSFEVFMNLSVVFNVHINFLISLFFHFFYLLKCLMIC